MEKNFDHKEIKLEDGKYRVIIRKNPFDFKVLRYGEPWRNLIGDHFVFALCQRVLELEDHIKKLDIKER